MFLIGNVIFLSNTKIHLVQVGGNRKAREFFDTQDDWDETLPLNRRYNSRAAALYRDKVSYNFVASYNMMYYFNLLIHCNKYCYLFMDI